MVVGVRAWGGGVCITIIIGLAIDLGRGARGDDHQIVQRAGWFHRSTSPPVHPLCEEGTTGNDVGKQ